MGNSLDSLPYSDLSSFLPIVDGPAGHPTEGYYSEAHPDVLYREHVVSHRPADEPKFQFLKQRVAALPKTVQPCISLGRVSGADGTVSEKCLYSEGTYTLDDFVGAGKVQAPNKELFYTVLSDLIQAGAELESKFEVHRDIAQATVTVHPNRQLLLSNPYTVQGYSQATADTKLSWLGGVADLAGFHTTLKERAGRGQNDQLDQMYREFDREVKTAVRAAVATAAHTAVGKRVAQANNLVDKAQALDSLQRLEPVLDAQNFGVFKQLLEKPVDDSNSRRFSDLAAWKPASKRIQLPVQTQEYLAALKKDLLRVRQATGPIQTGPIQTGSIQTGSTQTGHNQPQAPSWQTSALGSQAVQTNSLGPAMNGPLGGFQNNNLRERQVQADGTGAFGASAGNRSGALFGQASQPQAGGTLVAEVARDLVQLKKFMVAPKYSSSTEPALLSGAVVNDRGPNRESVALSKFRVTSNLSARRDLEYSREPEFLREQEWKEKELRRDRELHRERDTYRDATLFDRYRRDSYLEDYKNYVSELEYRKPVRRRFVERNRFGLEGRLLDPVVDPPFFEQPRRSTAESPFASKQRPADFRPTYDAVGQFFTNPPLERFRADPAPPLHSDVNQVVHLHNFDASHAVPISSQVFHLPPTRLATKATHAWNPSDYFQPEPRTASYSLSHKAAPMAAFHEAQTDLPPGFLAAAPQQGFDRAFQAVPQLPAGFLDAQPREHFGSGRAETQPVFAAAGLFGPQEKKQAVQAGPAPQAAGYQGETNYQTNLFQNLVEGINAKPHAPDSAPTNSNLDYVNYLKSSNRAAAGPGNRPRAQTDYDDLFGSDKTYHAPMASYY